MNTTLDSQCFEWRNRLSTQRATLFSNYQNNRHSRQLLEAHARLIDDILHEIWRTLPIAESAALIAVGGYGRRELFPHSDLDILILLPDHPGAEYDNVIENFVGTLWDIGLEIGHSVRTIDDCIAQSSNDITIATNLLEQRFIAGNQPLQQKLEQSLFQSRDTFAFVIGKLLEKQQRHARYFGVANNLEPNVKESPGGLRDLHTLLWISKAIGLGERPSQLLRQGILTHAEERLLEHNIHQLEMLRIDLHLAAKRREERLIFDLQQQLAHTWKFTDQPGKRASEQLMQLYFKAARTILQLSEILLPILLSHHFSPLPHSVIQIDDRFCSVNGLLELKQPDLFEKLPSTIFETFLLLQRRNDLNGLAPRTLRALWHARAKINAHFRQQPDNKALFLQIFREPRLTRTLRRMNLYGVLGKYLPAFGRIMGQMQHDLFHVYTVDEHILMVIRNLRRLLMPEFNHELPLLSRLMNDFEKPELLYLAALFHDIAKGSGMDHSQEGMIHARKFCETHQLSNEDTELVVWLVGQHLQMSLTAQKQDIDDPQVVQCFAELVSTPRRLTALYLLTVADIRATGPKVWNAWKGKLLEELYLSTVHVLRHGGQDIASALEDRKQQAQSLLRLYAVPEDAIQAFWRELDTVYFLRHDVQEIAWHARLLNRFVHTEQPIVRTRLADEVDGVQVLIYTPDKEALFARLCTFFSRINYSIADAKVYTTRHGYALDTFNVFIPEYHDGNYRDLLNFIEFELSACLNETNMPSPPSGRISRHLRYFPIQPRVQIRPDDNGNYYILSFIAGDRPSLLARVAQLLADYHISVFNAKIMTMGGRVEDSFLLAGESLQSEKQRLELEKALLQILIV